MATKEGDLKLRLWPAPKIKKGQRKEEAKPAAVPVAGPRGSSPVPEGRASTEEELMGKIMARIGFMMDVKLEAVMARLPPERLRPPLAADGKKRLTTPSAVPAKPAETAQTRGKMKKDEKRKVEERGGTKDPLPLQKRKKTGSIPASLVRSAEGVPQRARNPQHPEAARSVEPANGKPLWTEVTGRRKGRGANKEGAGKKIPPLVPLPPGHRFRVKGRARLNP